jgi:hypothetical protein
MQIALASVFSGVLVSPCDLANPFPMARPMPGHCRAAYDTRGASRIDCARRSVRGFLCQILLPDFFAARPRGFR